MNSLFTLLTMFALFIWPCYSFSEPNSANVDALKSTFFSVSPEVLGQDKFRLLDKKIKPASTEPKFTLPALKQIPDQDQRLSNSVFIFIQKIELIGHTVFSRQTLSSLTKAYEQRSINIDELENLKQALTRYYVDRGYINSGAIIPDQKISDGILTIQIIEGRLSTINITGNDGLQSRYINNSMAYDLSDSLNINTLQESLLLLQQDPLIKGISAELRPGEKRGESKLQIKVKEARPYQVGVVFGNNRSPSIGSFNGKIWLTHRNLMGFGDTVNFSYGRTEGLNDYSGSYTFPINIYDSLLGFYYQNSQSNVVENPFKALDISSRSETYGVLLKKAFYQTVQHSFSMQISFEHRRSKTFLLDQAFSFSEGIPDKGDEVGESRISVLRFSQDWLDRNQSQVIAFRSTFNLGIDAFDATINSIGIDSQFFSWLGQFQWIRRLPVLDSELIFRSNLQLTGDSLLPLEKFSVGGQNSVRGYRENQFVRDNAAAVSLEWRVPIFNVSIPGLSQSIDDGKIQLAMFADFGWAENNKLETINPKTIGSWGLGILWTPAQQLHSELYWGTPFNKIKQDAEHDIQDSGIHFRIQLQLI